MEKTIIEKLATCFQVSEDNVHGVMSKLAEQYWNGSDLIQAIQFAGCIDNGDPNKVYGHTGYWIADGYESIAYVTNADAVWVAWDEETAQAIGLPWGSFSASMEKHRV
jgi:hypothetical protein